MKHNFDKIVDRKGSYCTQWDYIKDRFGVNDILPFSISDTDFTVAEEILTDLQKTLNHKIFGYTRWNHDDFKNSIVSHYRKSFNSDISNDWIVYSPSVMYSVSVIIRLMSEKGDSIAVFDPMYDAFINVIEKNERKIESIPLDRENLTIDFELLEKSVAKSKIFLLCSPHNPTGKVFKKSELEKIVDICKKYNVFIISDEIHSDIILWGNKHYPITDFYNDYTNMVIVNSASKTFNIPALGGSYAIIPINSLRELFLKQTRQMDFVNSAAIMGMIATMSAYNKADYYIEELVSYIESNMLILKKFIDEEIKCASFNLPQSTYLAWINIENSKLSREEIQKLLVEKGKVGIMAGEVYGKNGEGYLRMNIGCPKEKLIDGLNRFKYAFEDINGDENA